jgi:hypothetical protein
MGVMRKSFGMCSLLLLLAAPLQAGESLTRMFAGCVGRFSAEREHAWLLGSEETPRLEAQREAFLALLDAAPSEAPPRQTLAYRIEAKMAHAALLTEASFGTDPQRARRASVLATRHIGLCQSLLLEG